MSMSVVVAEQLLCAVVRSCVCVSAAITLHLTNNKALPVFEQQLYYNSLLYNFDEILATVVRACAEHSLVNLTHFA